MTACAALPPDFNPGVGEDDWAAPPPLERTFTRGLLWRIEKVGNKTSYIFGTMHSDDPRVVNVPAPVTDAMAHSKAFAMELVMDERATEAMTKFMYYSESDRLSTLLGKPLYERTIAALAARGVPETTASRMQVWLIIATLSLPRTRSGDFLDLHLMKAAQQQKMSISGLETIAEQLRPFQELDNAQQVILLSSVLEQNADMDSVLETAHDLYIKRDLAGLMRLNNEIFDFSDPLIKETLMRYLISDRNLQMAVRFMRLMRNENTFAAIGAMHLPGNEGVLNLLKQRGYQVTLVY
ncbi:MAG: TraB/GumN family protein [Gammaproteobacteria bacterium]|nr:TraB/GumN family protein [Gammaproteobacteria bacterium]